jgi:hypothetical protein
MTLIYWLRPIYNPVHLYLGDLLSLLHAQHCGKAESLCLSLSAPSIGSGDISPSGVVVLVTQQDVTEVDPCAGRAEPGLSLLLLGDYTGI